MFTIAESSPATEQLILHFSKLYRLKRATAWFLRVKELLKSRICKEMISFQPSLSVAELKRAEIELVKYEQNQHFTRWIVSLSTKKPMLKMQQKKTALFRLDPILVDGVLRVGGRLERAPIEYDARHPIILPHASHFTDLMIQDCHESTGHSGLNGTLNKVAQRFWVIKGNAATRRVLQACIWCRHRNARPGEQIMCDLPSPRLQMNSHPFAYTGVDYFGPLSVRVNRSKVKRYGCLFTCLTTRAVHLEVASDLSADAFINAFRRFISRRGPILHMYSDNGTNLVGAERLLRESIQQWNQRKVEGFLHQREVEWTFNPASASHMGGAWERMIRSVRRLLLSLSNERTLTDDQLHTLMLEAEAILNARPLTPVKLDCDGMTPLTPNHLLRVNPSASPPPSLTEKTDCYARQKWKHVQYLADQFWKRWSREYLRTIIARQKWHRRNRNFMVNDVVLIVDDTAPRSQWSCLLYTSDAADD